MGDNYTKVDNAVNRDLQNKSDANQKPLIGGLQDKTLQQPNKGQGMRDDGIVQGDKRFTAGQK